MTWDSPLVSALAQELETRLRGARLRAHSFLWEEREVVLWFRSAVLRWKLHPRRGWLTLASEEAVPEGARPLSATVLGVVAPPDERRLEIRLLKDRGRVRAYALAVELMTNQWNALLLEGEERRIRHLLWTRHLEDRTLSVGYPYLPPEPSRRKGISAPLTEEDWRRLLTGPTEQDIRRAILEGAAFTSPINLPYLMEPLGRSGETPARSAEPDGGGAGPPASNPGPDGRSAEPRARSAEPEGGSGEAHTGREERVAGSDGGEPSGYMPDPLPEIGRRWNRLKDAQPREPCILEFDGDKQPYPIVLKTYKHIHISDLLTAIQAAAREDDGPLETEDVVREHLQRALQRARGRIRGLERELAQAADPEEPRSQANLLLARLAEVPRGAREVTLPGFDGAAVRIELDPTRTPQDNAGRLYEEAARRDRARERLPGLLKKAEAAVRKLEGIEEDLSRGVLPLEEIRRRIPSPRRHTPAPGRGEERLPFRRYLSSGGLEIRVGRSSRDNDALTFHHSHPEDVWLHARDRAGAHVILRWQGEGSPPQRDLAEAAILAALHSGARGSGSVPVDWTRRKYVRKPRKAPPGTVIPERVRTLFVEPDPEVPRRLRRKADTAEEE